MSQQDKYSPSHTKPDDIRQQIPLLRSTRKALKEKLQAEVQTADDDTGMIVGAWFDKQETLSGYYHVFRQILTDYGIPYMFYTDRRTIFEYRQKNSPSLENDTFTQFGYACKQLGVDLKTTSIPQAKGRIERLFGTLQSRLPAELQLAGISTIEQANELVQGPCQGFADSARAD